MFIGEGKFESLLSKINQDILLEKRRGGYSDPSVVEQLEKYKDGKHFISFSHNLRDGWGAGDSSVKLGINPKNKYNTPTGIYSYPIWATWRDIEYNSLPFASDRRNIFVFKPKDQSRIAFASSYTKEQMIEDYKELIYLTKGRQFNMYSDRQIDEKYQQFLDDADLGSYQYPKHPLSFIWNVSRELVYRKVHKWAALLYKLYDGIVDDLGFGIIHSAEPTQGIFFNSRAIEVVDLIKRPNLDAAWGGARNILIKSKEKLENFSSLPVKTYTNIVIQNIRDNSLDINYGHDGKSTIITNSKFNRLDVMSRYLKIQGSEIDEVDLEDVSVLLIEGNTKINKFINGDYIKNISLKNTYFNPFDHGLVYVSDMNLKVDNWGGADPNFHAAAMQI